jgi:hypothetical protein
MTDADEWGGVIVYRPWNFFGCLRGLQVLINEHEVGTIRTSGRFVFDLPPGEYTVQVAVDWCKCEPYPIRVSARDFVELEAGLQWRELMWWFNMVAVVVCPRRVFVLRPAFE